MAQLRRSRWRDRSLDELVEGVKENNDNSRDFTPSFIADASASPEQQAIRQTMLATVQRAIAEKLTEKQREVMLAVRVQGLSLGDVAQRTDISPNTLYKRLFDARKRLEKELLAQGVPTEDILASFYRHSWQR